MTGSSKTAQSAFALALAAVLAVGALAALADEGHKHGESANKEVTLQGEVLDLYCYMKHPDDGQGADHIKCAKSCIRKGLPIGFLADGEVYLLIGKDHESAADLVVAFAGTQARLTGTLIVHHDIKSIEVKTIEKIDASGSK